MSQQRQEMLSALFDGQTSEFETRRVLSDMTDAELQQLRRYQLMRDACKNQVSGLHRTMDITAAVSAAVAAEAAPSQSKALASSRIKPLLGFATAATVAFVAVLGVQQWRHLDDAAGNAGFVADGNVSASQLPIAATPGLSTASGVSSLPLGRSAVVAEPVYILEAAPVQAEASELEPVVPDSAQ